MSAAYDLIFGGKRLGRPISGSFENGVLSIETKGGFIITIPCRLVGPLDFYLAQLGDA